MRNTKKITALILAALTFAVTSANALTEAQLKTLVKNTLANVATPEKPVKVSLTVALTPAKDQEQVAVALVQEVVRENKSAVIAVVSAICMKTPSVAPAVAKAAAKIYPELAESIAVVAVKDAPQFAQQIVQAVTSVVPTIAAKLNNNSLTTRRSADGVSGSGTITVNPGIMSGYTNTPHSPPSPPASQPVVGVDPARYGTP